MYGIYKITIDEKMKWDQELLARETANAYLITIDENWSNAVEFAKEFAAEHANRINVECEVSGNFKEDTGATFVTNNGTRVWYTAKPLGEN